MRIIKNLGFVLLFVLFFFTVPFSDTPSRSDDPDSYLSSTLTLCSKAHANDLPDKCKLFGKIQIVDNFTDVKVKIVNNFPDIKVKKVNFGHGGTSAKKAGQKTMRIKKDNPGARASFRARHKCDQKKDKTTAGYWSCKKW